MSNAQPVAFHAKSSNLASAWNGVTPFPYVSHYMFFPIANIYTTAIATYLASGLRINAAQSSPIQPLSYADLFCSLPSLEPYDATRPPGSPTLLSIFEYRGKMERDRGLSAFLRRCVLLSPVLPVDYELDRCPSGTCAYEVVLSWVFSTDYVDVGIVGLDDNTASDLLAR